MNLHLKHFVLAAGLLVALPAFAKTTVNLQAEARREVANDVGFATLYVELDDKDAARLADKVNRSVTEALAVSKPFSAVRVTTGGNSSYPIYGKSNRIDGWRARAEVRLNSKDFRQLAELIGKLQQTMQLTGVNFSVSPEAREAAENQLVQEAMQAFKRRAELVQRALGAKSYQLANISLNTRGGVQPQQRFESFRAAPMAEAAIATPSFEAGSGEVTVNVSGAVEISD